MSLAYAGEKLNGAVYALATGRGRIKERLADAFVYHLSHVEGSDLPADLRRDFAKLMKRATSAEAEFVGEGKIHASVRGLSEDDAVEMAHQITELAAQVEALLEL